jgi:hypothetical protein
MSAELVTIQPAGELATQSFGESVFGGSSSLFSLKPAQVELQQKTSRAEGSQEGKFRNGTTGEHYDEIHAVLIFQPSEPRSMYRDKNTFGEQPICYSMDGKAPAERAQDPQALNCARCRNSDWTKWKKTRKSDDLPKCKSHFSGLIVDRASKVPYRLGVRGKSVSEFRKAMQRISELAELYKAQHGKYPQLFDFSFKIKSIRKVDTQGVYYIMQFSDIGLINETDRAEFGELYLKFVSARNNGELVEEGAAEEEKLDEELTESGSQDLGNGPVIDAAATRPAVSQEEVTI